MRASLLITLAMVAACAPELDPSKDATSDTAVPDTGDTGAPPDTAPSDADGDGFEEGEDCDDGDPMVHPGAGEICDGVDQDCDGTVDEDAAADAPAWYADADADGFGDAGVVVTACAAPTGFVAEPTDCDDAAPTVFPEAPEHCDGVDEDCDGVVDEGAVDAATWYVDADGDHFGDPSSARLECAAPSGGLAAGGDCDDADPTIHPGAEEACDEAVDRNCDGSVSDADGDGDGVIACDDCDDRDPAWSVGREWYVDADGDGFGGASIGAVACLAPHGFGEHATDCDDTDATVYPGAPERWYDDVDQACDGGSDWDADGDGFDAYTDDCLDTNATVNPEAVEVCDNDLDDDCDGDGTECVASGDYNLSAATLRMLGDTGDAAGWAVTGAPGLFDGGSRAGLVVGGTGNRSGAGAAWVVDVGARRGDLRLADAYAKWEGEAPGDHAGYAVAAGGDIDGDGIQDLLVGTVYESTASGEAGAVYLVSAEATGTASLATASAKLLGMTIGEGLGSSLAILGDVDGDGYDDFAAGSIIESTVAPFGGAVYLVHGPVAGEESIDDVAEAKLQGEADFAIFGRSLASADLDGDGAVELVVGADGSDAGAPHGGAVYVYQLPLSGLHSADAADFVLLSTQHTNSFGYDVATPGDVTGDGYDDIVAGAIANATYAYGSGAAYVFAGPLTGDLDTGDATAVLYGTELRDGFGVSVSGAGDQDFDGLEDLAVGADDTSGVDEGRVAIFYSPVAGALSVTDAGLVLYGEMPDDYVGWDVACVGDADGDTYPDLLIGAQRFDGTLPSQGAAYLWSGSGI